VTEEAPTAPPLQTYKLETLCPLGQVDDARPTLPAAEHADALGMYLLDLMRAHDYEVVGGVRYEVPEPEVAPYPAGWCVLRALVDVREFDEDFGAEDEDEDEVRHCQKCGAVCDHRVQVCECDPAVCPLPIIDR